MNPSSIFDSSTSSLLNVDFDEELLDAVSAHWHDSFVRDPRRDEVAHVLGLRLEQAVEFGVGLSDRTLGLRIPSRGVKAGRLLRERLVAWGVLRASGHEAFRGCVVVPVRQEERIVALFARRIDDPTQVHWASGLPGGVFTKAFAPSRNETSPDRCVVTTSIPDALAVIGAASSDETVGPSLGAITLLAPARPKGYAVKDVKQIAARGDKIVVLGRGSDDLVDRLRAYGASATHLANDLDVARTLNTASDAGVALLSLLGELRSVETSSPPSRQPEPMSGALDVRPETSTPSDIVEPSEGTPVVVTSNPDRDGPISRLALVGGDCAGSGRAATSTVTGSASRSRCMLKRVVDFISTRSTFTAHERARTSSTPRRVNSTWSVTRSSPRWGTCFTNRKSPVTNRDVTMYRPMR